MENDAKETVLESINDEIFQPSLTDNELEEVAGGNVTFCPHETAVGQTAEADSVRDT
jgi:hypothetical protein